MGRVCCERRARHHREVRADEGRQVDLVDHEQVRPGDPWAALPGHFVAAGDVDDEDLPVDQPATEGRGEVVAPGLDQYEPEVGKTALERLDRVEVRRDVVADRRVGTAAGLHSHDPLGLEHAGPAEEVRVLGRVDVVRDHSESNRIAK